MASSDQASGADALAIVRYPGPLFTETPHLKGVWRVEKFDAPVEWYAREWARLHGTQADMAAAQGMRAFSDLPAHLQLAADALMRGDKAPYDVSEFTNLLLNAGINALWNIFFGNTSGANTSGAAAGANAVFNNAQARIGVGDSTTAAAATQTDLQAATNKYWQVMDATFPSVSGQAISFKITVASGNANFAWQEWGVDNCGGSNATSTTRSGGAMLNRAVAANGTKASGATWVPTATITLS